MRAFRAAALAAVLVMGSAAQTVLIVMHDQPGKDIAAAQHSPAASAQHLAEQDHSGARQASTAAQLLSRLSTRAKEVTATIQAAAGPEQDAIAAKLSGLGAASIRRFTVLNMIEADLPPPSLDSVKGWPEVAEVMAVGSHQALLDSLEQAATDPANWNVPTIEDNDEAFLRLVDRAIDDRDLLVAGRAMNAIPPGDYPANSLASVGSFSHLPVRAVQLNGASSDYVRDSVSDNQPYRFYMGSAQGGLQSTLVWDRHFADGLQPLLRSLSLSLFQSDGSALAAANASGQTLQQASLAEGGGDMVLKVRLDASADGAVSEPFTLALSQAGFQRAQGPKLRVACVAAHCTVYNDGDLPAFDVVGTAAGTEFHLGTIAAAGNAGFSPDSATTDVKAVSKSFGEIMTAAATDPCTGTWSIAPNPLTLNKANNWVGTVSVGPPAGCTTPWMAWPGPGPLNQVFAVLSAGFTTGPGSVTVQGTPNPPLPSMTDTILITKAELSTPFAGFAAVNIGDSVTPCTYSATASGALNAPYSGGSVAVSVTADSGCDSTVTPDNPSIVPGTLNGTANWTATFNITSNIQPNQSTTTRTANLIAASTTNSSFTSRFAIQQSGLSCTFSPGALSLPPAGIAQGTPQILTLKTNTDCQWTAVSSSTFVHFVQPANTIYSNVAGAQYWVEPNTTGAKRPAIVSIGGQTVSGDQDPQPPPPALSISKPVAGDTVLLTKNGKPNSITVAWKYDGPAGITGQFDLVDPNGKVYALAAAQTLQAATMTLVKPIPAGVTPDSGYTVRITPSDKSPAVSSGSFTIASELAIAAPVGNPAWTAGSTYRIRVTGAGLTVNVWVQDKKGTGQKIAVKSLEAVPAGGLNIDWLVPATLAAGDYVVHADEVSSSNGQTATAPFHVIAQQFTVNGRVTIPGGTQFATLTGCTVTIAQKHADGSYEDLVVAPCDQGTWSAQLNRNDSSGNEITYRATVERKDYTFDTSTQQFKASDIKPNGSYEFKVTVESTSVMAVGSNGVPIPGTTLHFLDKAGTVDVGDPYVLDADINGSNTKWSGKVPKGAIRVTATAPGDIRLSTAGHDDTPLLTGNVLFAGTRYSAIGSIVLDKKIPNADVPFAWAAAQAVTITFSPQPGGVKPTAVKRADASKMEVRWSAYGFDNTAQYRAQGAVPDTYLPFAVQPPSNNQAIEPKSGNVSPFKVTESR
jgi:hypothetical protein